MFIRLRVVVLQFQMKTTAISNINNHERNSKIKTKNRFTSMLIITDRLDERILNVDVNLFQFY